MPKRIEMSNGALEGLAVSTARVPTGFCKCIASLSFRIILWIYSTKNFRKFINFTKR